MKVLRLPRRTAVSFRPLRELDRAAIVTGASVSRDIAQFRTARHARSVLQQSVGVQQQNSPQNALMLS